MREKSFLEFACHFVTMGYYTDMRNKLETPKDFFNFLGCLGGWPGEIVCLPVGASARTPRAPQVAPQTGRLLLGGSK
jgi:hypothetical protein